jgi:integrase
MSQTSSKSDSNRFVFEPTRKPWLRRLSANGQYYLWWKHNNKRHQFKLNTDNYATAVARGEDEIQKLKAQDQSPLVNDGKIALGELLEHFLKRIHRQVESKQLKQTSYEAIVDGVNKIKRERADWLARPAAKIADKEIDDYVHGLRTTQSPTTVNRVVDVLRRSYSLAVDERLLVGNPTLKLKRAKLRAVKTDEIPTEEQYQQLLAEIRNGKLSHKWHVIDLVEFLSNYGCRIKEARNILKSDVDLEGRTIRIVGDPDPDVRTKNGSVRFVPIFDHTLPLIQRLLARNSLRIYGKEVRTDNLLAIGKCYGAINSAARKLHIPAHGHHIFRHLCATRWIEMGVNIKHVAKWLGHQDGGKLALQIYTKARDSQDKAEAAKVKGTLVPTKQPTNVAPLAPPVEEPIVTLDGQTFTKAQLAAALKWANEHAAKPSVSAHVPSATTHPAKSA